MRISCNHVAEVVNLGAFKAESSLLFGIKLSKWFLVVEEKEEDLCDKEEYANYPQFYLMRVLFFRISNIITHVDNFYSTIREKGKNSADALGYF